MLIATVRKCIRKRPVGDNLAGTFANFFVFVVADMNDSRGIGHVIIQSDQMADGAAYVWRADWEVYSSREMC